MNHTASMVEGGFVVMLYVTLTTPGTSEVILAGKLLEQGERQFGRRGRDRIFAVPAAALDLESLIPFPAPYAGDAVFNALCRLHRMSFYEAVQGNFLGIEPALVAPDLAGFDIDASSRGYSQASRSTRGTPSGWSTRLPAIRGR